MNPSILTARAYFLLVADYGKKESVKLSSILSVRLLSFHYNFNNGR